MAAPLMPPPEAGSERVNILVVDDLAEKLLAYRMVLEELGENVVTARSGAEALREVLAREFAVVLLDVNMPDIDGMETARLMRQYGGTAHTPIIFITAHADEIQMARGYSLGAVDYINSPVVPDVLRTKVRVFAELARMQRRTRALAEERVALARAQAARAAAEEARRRSEFLSQAAGDLGASLELEAGMERLLARLVPGLAEGAELRVALDGEGEIVRAAGSRHGERVRLALRAGPAEVGSLSVVPAAALDAADRALLEELAGRAAIAFDNARLYRRLQREMERSRQAEAELQDVNRRKDEFLAMLSHELRNPLAPIRNAAEVIRRVAPADARLEWARDSIDRQVTHLSQLVDELLDVSRITRGTITLRREPVDLARVLEQAIESARPLIHARKHRLTTSLPGPVRLSGDFGRLIQVFGNLLTNAAKYTPEGGAIHVAVSAREGEAVVSVRDNGLGIDAHLLPHVFDLFVQGERSLDRSQGGLGIGLTVVRHLVTLHGGRIEAASEGRERGAEFTVVLPCVSQVGEPEPKEAVTRAALAEGLPRRILVVDDNADAAESIAVFLRLAGHEVRTASDGVQALSWAKLFAPEVLILDIGLPRMDGYELARRLSAFPETSTALMIAVSGYGHKDDRAQSKAAGFHHHFVKPSDPRALLQVIAEGVGARRVGAAADSVGA